METVSERIARLALKDISDARLASLTTAHELNVDDTIFAAIGNALRVCKAARITLPPHRFENLSRGRGWARMGRGNDVQWGERADAGGYVVGPGRWVVGGNDGFSRKGENTWHVEHVMVGEKTWTIAS